MDINSTGFEMTEIVGGLIAIVASYAYGRKKFSFDNLEIAKSDTERELITLLREQIKSSVEDLSDLKNKYNELEQKCILIGRERDEAIQENQLKISDLSMYQNKIENLEVIIKKLTDALEATSAELNNED